MSDAITRGIRVQVEPTYHPERSIPGQQWFFSYKVTITNEGTERVQLVSRHWIITDATGEVRHVRGPGVVGETPVLDPGEAFEYRSACPLPTSLGAMHGTFQMEVEGGEGFDAEVAPFTLADPMELC